MKRQLKIALLLGAALAVSTLAVSVILAVSNTRQLHDRSYWVTHTQDVIHGLDNVVLLVTSAESGLRGYLLTGEPRYLEPYSAVTDSVGVALAGLQVLVADNPQQQARFAELRQRVQGRLETLSELAESRRAAGYDPARELLLIDQGKQEMEGLREVVGEMIVDERALLTSHGRNYERSYQTALISGGLSGALALTVIAAYLLLLRSNLLQLDAANQTIAEQAERLRTTLASIGDAVISVDCEAAVTNMNAVAETLTGWTLADALGQPLAQVFRIINETSRQPVASPAIRALREGVIVGLANHTLLIARDGVERHIDDSAAPIRCKDGEIVGCVLVFRDIGERRQAEMRLERTANELREIAAQLSEADLRKNNFLAMLAHELRNPLAPISNALRTVQRLPENPTSVLAAAAVMERQVRQVVRLVDDLLDISRISHGKIELRRESVALAQIIQMAVETSQPLLDAARHQLIVALPSTPVWLDADPLRLAQSFSNLLNNACKYSEPGGRIELTVSGAGKQVLVSIKDSGIGIAADRLGSIFELFTQVDQSQERSHGGLGIGLTLVQQLVGLHGGTVRAYSAGPGLGSEFVVSLPVIAEHSALAPVALASIETPIETRVEAGIAPAAATGRRILVVDDNEDSAASLAMLLDLNGNQTAMAHDGLEALRQVDSFRPAVVLLDLGLPKLNGYEVARRIRAQPGGERIVLVALTGWGQEDDLRKTREAGFDQHLVKPANYAVLMAYLESLPADGVAG
ncbi:MAG: CHASE3 domain-containing protein [Nevskia sp.]|nr:CHASE3 domain-containing protein [Nevskia sp.]